MPAEVSEWSKLIGSFVSMEVEKFSPQLFIKSEYEGRVIVKPYASAVLFQAADRYFVITAGHNFPDDENPENIGVLINNELISFEGSGVRFEENSAKEYNPANYDLAVIELDHRKVEIISLKYMFLVWTNLALTHINGSALYLMFGYPQRRKTTALPIGAIEADASFYLDPIIDNEKTLILNLRQKRSIHAATGQIQRLPMLHGISGAGVWGVDLTSEARSFYQLVSIVTGQNKDKNALYTTKLTHLGKLMGRHFL